VNPATFGPVNLRVTYDVAPEEIVDEQYLPPETVTEDGENGGAYSPPEKLDNGQPAPPIAKYVRKRVELQYPTKAAYDTVSRRPGAERLKLLSYHAFYTALEEMATYWDTSEDQYFEIEDKEIKGLGRPVYKGKRVGTGRNMPEMFRERCIKGFVEVVAWDFGLRLL
jgi:hypothetical protein